MIDNGTKTMLGECQMAWLKDGLKASNAKIKIIASGSEWQRNSHADSWSSYPANARLSLISSVKRKSLAFYSYPEIGISPAVPR